MPSNNMLSFISRCNGFRWTISGILLISALYTYSIKKLTTDDEDGIGMYKLKADYFETAKRLQARQLAQIAEDKRQRQIFESKPFRFLDLPPEIAILILSHCATWPITYQSLVRVSKQLQRFTFHACLPKMPIRLITNDQMSSLDELLNSQPQAISLVQHVWMTPFRRELLPVAISIIKKCVNLRSIASNAYIIQESITPLTHPMCKELTLLSIKNEDWTTLLNTSNGAAFFQQLTHLRLIGDHVPEDFILPTLTHFSYGRSRTDISDRGQARVGMDMLANKEIYPSLCTVILTKPRLSAGGLRISRVAAKTRVFLFELPPKRTELEIWCDNVTRSSMWELCAETRPSYGIAHRQRV